MAYNKYYPGKVIKCDSAFSVKEYKIMREKCSSVTQLVENIAIEVFEERICAHAGLPDKKLEALIHDIINKRLAIINEYIDSSIRMTIKKKLCQILEEGDQYGN